MVVLNCIAINVLVCTFFLASAGAVTGKWAISLAGCAATLLVAAALRWWMRYWGWDGRDARNVYLLVALLGGVGFIQGIGDEDYALSAAFLTSCVAAIALAEWLRRRDPALRTSR
jgi:predicted permease